MFFINSSMVSLGYNSVEAEREDVGAEHEGVGAEHESVEVVCDGALQDSTLS